MANTSQKRSDAKVAHAVEYLKLAQRDMERARTARLHYAHLGRSFGMTNAEIGAALGVTEVAARMLIKRNPEVA